jgi:magnesium transporter
MARMRAETSAVLRTRLHYRRRHQAPGTMPGTLVIDEDAHPSRMTVLAFGPDDYVEHELTDLAEIDELQTKFEVVWLNIDGLGDEQVLRAVGKRLHLHRLALEDMVNLGQRAKVEFHDDHVFVVLRMAEDDWTSTEQISLILQSNLVVTLQERPGDCFEPVRTRIRQAMGVMRARSADYLAYAIIDAVVDRFFPALDQASETLDALEDEVFYDHGNDTLLKLHALKRQLVTVRKAITPHREALNELLRDGGEAIQAETLPYLRDCYDNVIRLGDLIDAQREVASDLLQTYLSLISNKMNEVMKVLTIIATVFIPLSFIAGLYGMNFDPGASVWNMPELGWRFGYPAALAMMGAVAAGLLWFIRRKGWM